MPTIEFKVPGRAIGKQVRTLPSGIPVISTAAKRYISTVRAAAQSVALREGWVVPERETPVTMTIHAFWTIPKSWPKAKRELVLGWPYWKPPDFDNITKSVSDAIQGRKRGGRHPEPVLVVEDSSISGGCWKWWTEGEPYTHISVTYNDQQNQEVKSWTQSRAR